MSSVDVWFFPRDFSCIHGTMMLLDFDSWSRHVDDGCFPPGEATFFLVAFDKSLFEWSHDAR
jgi:hypothetical protein